MQRSVSCYSKRFVKDLISAGMPAEAFRECISPPRSRTKFYELVGDSLCRTVAVKQLGTRGRLLDPTSNLTGWVCPECKGQLFHYVHPRLGLLEFVSAEDLPKPIPHALIVRSQIDKLLCVRSSTWTKLSKTKWKNVASSPLQIVAPGEVERKPVLPLYGDGMPEIVKGIDIRNAEIEQHGERISALLGGKLRFSKMPVYGSPWCNYMVEGSLNKVRCKVYLGGQGGVVTMDRFNAPCPFGLSFFREMPSWAMTEEFTSILDAPFPVFCSSYGMHVDCIRQTFDWHEWEDIAKAFQPTRNWLFIANCQCEFPVRLDFISELVNFLPLLARRFSTAPFSTLKRSVPARYGEMPGIVIKEENIPPELRPLLPLAIKWSISDDQEIAPYARKQGKRSVQKFLSAFKAHLDEIDAFCPTDDERTPVPDEVVVFTMAFQAFGELYGDPEYRDPE